MNRTICIDIGGTSTRVALYDQNMKKINFEKFDTDANHGFKTLNKICEFINKYKDIKKVGISAPGPADYENGIFFNLPNLPNWENIRFIEYIKNKTNITDIKSENDANLMALAHHHDFGGNVNDITQFFTISTGFGAGLIINNKIFNGSHGHAQTVELSPVSWSRSSGKGMAEGALEYFVSGSGIEAQGKEFKFSSTKEIFNLYAKNKNAKKIIDEGIETLANMIAVSAAFINPSIFVFDGSVSRNNNWYVEQAIKISKTRMYDFHWKKTRFEFSKLGDDAALIGAYYLMNMVM